MRVGLQCAATSISDSGAQPHDGHVVGNFAGHPVLGPEGPGLEQLGAAVVQRFDQPGRRTPWPLAKREAGGKAAAGNSGSGRSSPVRRAGCGLASSSSLSAFARISEYIDMAPSSTSQAAWRRGQVPISAKTRLLDDHRLVSVAGPLEHKVLRDRDFCPWVAKCRWNTMERSSSLCIKQRSDTCNARYSM